MNGSNCVLSFNKENNIPKKIHYVWMGGAEKTEFVMRCIESWKHYMPDYEIIEWNETNFDINCCDYVREAYNSKKWAFVSDVVRTYVLKEHGGVYFDTDIELFSVPQDIFSAGDVILGFDGQFLLSTGVMATVPHHAIYETLWKQYKRIHFENTDVGETINTKLTFIVLDYIEKRRITNGEYLIKNVKFYPKEYFSNNGMKGSTPIFAIHYFLGTWKKKTELTFFQYIVFMAKLLLLRFISVFLGNKTYINMDNSLWRNALTKTDKNLKKGARIYKKL